MFANQAFIIFSPILLFWAGAWVRRKHSRTAWSVSGLLLAFSMTVGIVGATDPMPRHGYDSYSAASALQRLGEPQTPVSAGAPLAGAEKNQ
jgi:hypothetical protein